MTYIRVRKNQARKLFEENKPFYIVSHKMRPGMPFQMGMTIYPEEDKKEGRTFSMLIDNWNYYNSSWETGYYPAFYIEK